MLRISYFFFFVTILMFNVAAYKFHQIPLRADGKTNLNWVIDYPNTELEFEIHVQLNWTSWFAVGFSDYGSLTSADFCVFWTDWRKKSHLQDVWTDNKGKIHLDESQDCKYFRYVRKDGLLKFSFFRKFDTCDPHDYVIDNGTTHVVWAEGPGPLFSLNGVNISSAIASGFERTQLLKSLYEPETHPPDTWKWDIHAQEVKVPNKDTTYWCQVFRFPDSLKKKQHIIQYEPTITKGNEHLVHHMEVFHCFDKPDVDIPNYNGPCDDPKRPEPTKVCKRVIAAWAMGAQAFSYPSETGLAIGGPSMNPHVMLEVHYNNPELKADCVDSSGIRLYITPTLRKYDGGVIELGLEYSDKMAIPPKQPGFKLSGYCIKECTAISLPEKGMIIFASQLHTHLTGIEVITRHIRNGKELAPLNHDKHYSTHFQEIRRLSQFRRILPGDELVTTCTYKTLDKDRVTLGGFSISDEMCVNYIHYYPKTDLEVCKSSVSEENLANYFDYLKSFENQPTSSSKPISENYQSIEWTPLRIQVLNDLYTQGTLSMQCNRSSGDRFPGNWEGVPSTKIMKPLPVKLDCKDRKGNKFAEGAFEFDTIA